MSYNPNDPRQRAIFEAGMRHAAQQQQGNYDFKLQEAVAALRNEQTQNLNRVAGHFRQQHSELRESTSQTLSNLATIAEAMRMQRSGGSDGDPGLVRIENIPGKRVPYTLLMDIPIGAGTTSVREQSVTISQEGPFVAVRRMASFISAYEFQVTNDVTGQQARLAGRSYGRWRPIHSAGDVVDSQHAARADTVAWFLAASAGPPAAATPLPTGTLTQPSNMSSFRTMEFDGRVTVLDAGSQYPRQNIPVPTSMWTQHINSPFDLAALDFFARGEVLSISVQPTHVNNPPAGNVDGECVFPAAAAAGFLGYPFLDGQYDAHEGICTPNGVVMGSGGEENDWEPAINDAIARLPDGILTIGWEGYRIIQIAGPVP